MLHGYSDLYFQFLFLSKHTENIYIYLFITDGHYKRAKLTPNKTASQKPGLLFGHQRQSLEQEANPMVSLKY